MPSGRKFGLLFNQIPNFLDNSIEIINFNKAEFSDDFALVNREKFVGFDD